ncbi:hypothetical protein TorRG33x02_266410, partial [Trema orientale]
LEGILILGTLRLLVSTGPEPVTEDQIPLTTEQDPLFLFPKLAIGCVVPNSSLRSGIRGLYL